MNSTKERKLNIGHLFVHLSFWGFIICLPIIYALFGAKLDTVNYENRNMTERPEFTLENIRFYPAQYENYYNDNFPFRNKLITLNSRITFEIFEEGLGSTIKGEDGWLFYNSENSLDGGNIAQFKGIAYFTDEELAQAAASLQATADWCEEHGCEFVLMIAPNKERVYAEYMPGYYVNARRSEQCNTDQLVEYLRENTDIRVVWAWEDLSEYKTAHPDEPMYYHLDTHWNYLGGYIGARALLRELGIDIPPADERERSIRNTSIGDLTMLMNIGESDDFHDTDYVFAGYPVEGMQMLSDNVNGTLSYVSEGRDPRSVVIYRDSFCNIMRYFLGEQFDYINMIPKEEWDPTILESNTPDVLVYEMTERFVERLVTEHIQP